MSTPLHDRFRELEAEALQVKVLPAAAVRARGHRRALRQRISVAVAVVVVAAGGGFAATHAGANRQAATPAGEKVTCTVSLPGAASQVKVMLISGGATAGILNKTLTGMRNGGLTVTAAPSGTVGDLKGDIVLRYGPTAVGKEYLLRAYFPGSVAAIFDPARRDDVIDVTIGPGFTASINTRTEINTYLVKNSGPVVPSQCTSAESGQPSQAPADSPRPVES